VKVLVRLPQLTLEALPLLLLLGLVAAGLSLHGRRDKWVPRLGGAAFMCFHEISLLVESFQVTKNANELSVDGCEPPA